jgi:hypothetical protein
MSASLARTFISAVLYDFVRFVRLGAVGVVRPCSSLQSRGRSEPGPATEIRRRLVGVAFYCIVLSLEETR